MDTLPEEMRCEIGKYLTSADLRVMRLLNSSWNDLAMDMLRSRHPDLMTFTFSYVKTLARFNDTFANHEPKSDFHSAKFGFEHPMLASGEVSAHLETFGDTFGQSVTSLTLCICRDGVPEGVRYWPITSKEREAVDKNVTILLSKVKGQSNRPRKLKLTLDGTMGRDWLRMRLPNMRVLEELTLREASLLAGDHDDDYLTSLRRVTMDYSANDLAMTFSSVRELTLVICGPLPEGEAFRPFTARFPNLCSLTCWIRFITLPAFFEQRHLTRLNISTPCLRNYFWETVTQGSPRLTFAQIVDLDVTSAGETQGSSFKDLENLRELIFTGSSLHVDEKLEAVLYLSKLGRLKRLQKLVFECVFRPANMVELERCLRELRKYHNSVTTISQYLNCA